VGKFIQNQHLKTENSRLSNARNAMNYVHECMTCNAKNSRE